MELKIKDKYIGNKVTKGFTEITLSNELSQRELLHIKNMISSEYIEEVKVDVKPKVEPIEKIEPVEKIETAVKEVAAYSKKKKKK